MTAALAHAHAHAHASWFDTVQAAFPDQHLCARIRAAAARDQATLPSLFEDIARHVLSSRGQSTHDAPANPKKRKLEDGSSNAARGGPLHGVAAGSAAAAGIDDVVVSFECKDVSFQVPARKKLKLQLVGDTRDALRKEVRLLQPATDQAEHTLAVEHIDQVFSLPVPEKQQRQWNFLVFPKAGATSVDGSPVEQIVFTMNEVPPAGVTTAANHTPADGDTYCTVTRAALGRMLQPFGKHVVLPSEAEFSSSIPQPHRKGEKAYHVNAHRGSKEGYLFFLENGVVFGFKKPLAFFPFSAIESISYTSVLQRTFNLVIAAMEGDAPTREVEFSMLDQADFAGIDDYVKRHGLNDASMAADRRAKAYNVNKEKKVETNGHPAEDGQTELQKAEQQLQDEEDEEEEDYEVSGGESDGEGEYSEDDEEGGEEEAEYEGDEGDEEDGEEAEHGVDEQ